MSKKLIAENNQQGISTPTTIPNRRDLVNEIEGLILDGPAFDLAVASDVLLQLESLLRAISVVAKQAREGKQDGLTLTNIFRLADIGAYIASDIGSITNESRVELETQKLPSLLQIARELTHNFSVNGTDQSIDSIGMTSFSAGVLRNNGIVTLDDLTNKSELDLLKMPKLGAKVLADIKERLLDAGLSLSAGGKP